MACQVPARFHFFCRLPCLRDGKQIAERAGAVSEAAWSRESYYFLSRAAGPSRHLVSDIVARDTNADVTRRPPCARPPRARMPKRRNTPAQKIVLEQVSSPTEVSAAGLIAFVPHSGVFSFRCLSARAVGQNRKSAFLERRGKGALDRSGGRSSDGGRPRRRPRLPRARRRRRAVEVNSCYPIVRKPARLWSDWGGMLSSHRASEAAAAAPRRETRARRASRERAAALPVAGGDTTRAPHVPHASRAGSMRDATIACRSRRTRGAPRGARAIV